MRFTWFPALAILFLQGCSGGGGGSATVGATLRSTTYLLNTQTKTYSDGSAVTNQATSSSISWGSDHVTKTTTYSFSDGGTNQVVDTVSPTVSTPTYTPANYPTNWTSAGISVTKPSVSAITNTYGDGTVLTVQDGTSTIPFYQTALSAQSISDPNSVVRSSTADYNLSWGTPDKNGPTYANLFSNGAVSQITLSSTLNMWGKTISGQCPLGPVFGFCLNGPTIGTPHSEVIGAWQQGWTGLGVNVMMEDALTTSHAVVTTLLASRYAPASSIYGYNFQTNTGVYNSDGTLSSPSSSIRFGVVNASYGANLAAIIGHNGPWTATELSNASAAYAASALRVTNRYTGATGFSNFVYTDAVITKAAGNDGLVGVTANQEPLVKALAANSSIISRLLVVGALNRAGSSTSPATISGYSNKAGTDTSIQNRFLVASGTTPFSTGDIAVNGIPVDATTSTDPEGKYLGNVGTSYAAPRVAGYVAILRSKFPNLDAVKTSSILLDTARYDTLTCNPNCDQAIYGKGEASLSRALAPVGRLR